jgi:hypothetical protein
VRASVILIIIIIIISFHREFIIHFWERMLSSVGDRFLKGKKFLRVDMINSGGFGNDFNFECF